MMKIKLNDSQKRITAVISFCLLLTGVNLWAQSGEVNLEYLNYNLPVEERAAILMDNMTLEEKLTQITNESKAIPRLGIPEYNWWNECLHGVARAGNATVFPQSITIACSFDRELMLDVATVISDEARAKYHESVRRGERNIYQGLDFWSPNINIFRDPRWGRGHETYGEDPYLTGEMGTQFIKGLQGDNPDYFKLIATSKHFAVHSGPEPLRHVFDAQVSDVDLYETYLPAFRKTVVEGGVYSIMGAYNRFRGEACCASDLLLQKILRDKWGFKGYVTSDCGAIRDFNEYHKITSSLAESAALGIKKGCDLNCGKTYLKMGEALDLKLVSEKEIDIAVARLLTARFKLGMFDPPEIDPYANIPYQVVCSPAHNKLARKAAQKSIVLLKNKDNTLPLDAESISTIAVVGPSADNFESLIGNYSGVPKQYVTAVKGIRNKLEPEVKVVYAQGSPLATGVSNMVPVPSCYLETETGQQGLKGEYFSGKDFSGDPVFTTVDDHVNFYWERVPPVPALQSYNYCVRWTGYLIPPVSGDYRMGLWGMPNMALELDGKEIFKAGGNPHHAAAKETGFSLEAGRKYKIVVEYINSTGDGDIQLTWAVPNENLLQEAVDAARKADVVVAVLGLSQRLEGEEMKVEAKGFAGGDRTSLDLPEEQMELLKALKATGKPVVLVLMTGSAMSINWAQENLDAIIYAGYAGEEGGNAIADVLFGDYNPAGRLPVTYYKSVDQLPDFGNYDMAGRTYRYFTDEPLYPFGYGLSYTSFSYSDLTFSGKINSGEGLDISISVKNTGPMAGEEVVQLYLKDLKGSTPRPIRQLEGFKRIYLEAGETKKVNFSLSPRQFSMINKKGQRVIEPGDFIIYAGGKQPGFTGYRDAPTTEVISKSLSVKGKVGLIED